jgi:hypothetical protein
MTRIAASARIFNPFTERAVTISDPVQLYEGKYWVGGFLDSEGNKLWFCSYA